MSQICIKEFDRVLANAIYVRDLSGHQHNSCMVKPSRCLLICIKRTRISTTFHVAIDSRCIFQPINPQANNGNISTLPYHHPRSQGAVPNHKQRNTTTSQLLTFTNYSNKHQSELLTLVPTSRPTGPQRRRLPFQTRSVPKRAPIRARPLRARNFGVRAREGCMARGEELSGGTGIFTEVEAARSIDNVKLITSTQNMTHKRDANRKKRRKNVVRGKERTIRTALALQTDS